MSEVRLVLDIMSRLSKKPHTAKQLERDTGVTYKTVLRVITAIETLGIPVIVEQDNIMSHTSEVGAWRLTNTYRIRRDDIVKRFF